MFQPIRRPDPQLRLSITHLAGGDRHLPRKKTSTTTMTVVVLRVTLRRRRCRLRQHASVGRKPLYTTVYTLDRSLSLPGRQAEQRRRVPKPSRHFARQPWLHSGPFSHITFPLLIHTAPARREARRGHHHHHQHYRLHHHHHHHHHHHRRRRFTATTTTTTTTKPTTTKKDDNGRQTTPCHSTAGTLNSGDEARGATTNRRLRRGEIRRTAGAARPSPPRAGLILAR